MAVTHQSDTTLNKAELRREKNRLAQQKRRQRLRTANPSIHKDHQTTLLPQHKDKFSIDPQDAQLDPSLDFNLDFLPDFDLTTAFDDLELITQEYQDQSLPSNILEANSLPSSDAISVSATLTASVPNPAVRISHQRPPYCRFRDGLSPIGRTALHLLSESSNGSAIVTLLTRKPVPVSRSRSIPAMLTGWTPSPDNTPSSDSSSDPLLHTSSISPRLDLLAQDEYGLTALHIACRAGNLHAVEALLDADELASLSRSADLHSASRLIDVRDGFGWTALHHAAWCGNEALVALLVERGAEIGAEIEVRDSLTLRDEVLKDHELCLSRQQAALLCEAR